MKMGSEINIKLAQRLIWKNRQSYFYLKNYLGKDVNKIVYNLLTKKPGYFRSIVIKKIHLII